MAKGYEFNIEKLEPILEQIAKNSSQPNILDEIEQLMKTPVELTKSPIKDISQIPSISYSLASDIKKLAKARLTIPEIIDSLNLDEERAYMLYYCSYIESNKPEKQKKELITSRSRVIEQMNRLKGFEQNTYQGSRTDVYQRIQAAYSNISAGVLFSKDLGEKYESSFLSGFLSYKNQNFNISIGDFFVESGLGNILWSQSAMGKGADVISPAFDFKNTVKDYKSAVEYGYFRGVTFSNRFQFNQFTELNVSCWGSNTQRAATVDTNRNIVTSIYQTGYFRTLTEINKIGKLNEKTLGGNVTLIHNNLNIGTSAYYLKYDKTIESSSSTNIRGSNALLKSIYAYVPISDFGISAEASADQGNNMAYKLISEFKKRDYVLIFHLRSFAPEFHSPYGYMFGEQSNPSNEYGIYSGFLYKGFDNIKFSTYVDVFGSYKRTYYVPEPINGIDIFNETIFNLSNGDDLRIRMQYENKTEITSIDSENDERAIFKRSKYYLRAEYYHYLYNWLRLKGRFEMNLINFESLKQDETGKSAYLEMLITADKKLKFSGRFSYFSTDSYESALWQYEFLFPGYMTSPPLYGNGFRTFISINWMPLPTLSIWARYVLMTRYNEEYIGSGYNTIYHNNDQRIYFQVDVKL